MNANILKIPQPEQSLKKVCINCRGKLLISEQPLIMGILNITRDSFFDGGLYDTEDKWLVQAEKMLKEKADIIDVGVCSTRPGAKPVSEQEEHKKLRKAIASLIKHFSGIIISADTFRASSAILAYEEGASIINDISAGDMDDTMHDTIASLKIPYIAMHIQGKPENMQINPEYNNVVKDVIRHLSLKVRKLKEKGCNDIIIDPGFGFGKNLQHNFDLMNNLRLLSFIGLPYLVGISRKSMIYRSLNITPEQSLNGTSVLNTIALLKGASVLRVHDVKEADEIRILIKNLC